MIGFNEDEVRSCATCESITCGHLAHDARVRSSSELAQVRTQINPPPVPATFAAEPQEKSQ